VWIFNRFLLEDEFASIYMNLLAICVFMLGFVIVLFALNSAVRSFLLPRAAVEPLGRIVFAITRGVFDALVGLASTYRKRDGIMALYAPMSLLVLLVTWLAAVLGGYTLMFWAVGVHPLRASFTISGSSLLTLGFAQATSVPTTVLAFSEAVLGLILVAVLVAYLPTIYAAFARREQAVALLEVRAGSPPSAVEMLVRFQRIGGWTQLRQQWAVWETWFVDIDESHTSLSALVFFRSPQPDRSWITAAGTVLDAAALTASSIDAPRDAEAELCIRAGFVALRHIADFFEITYHPDPHFPDQPISISRAEYDAAYDLLAGEGVALKQDREAAWLAFAGWRVNYDTVLLALAELTMAPSAQWSTDRVQPTKRRYRLPVVHQQRERSEKAER
jgi:hypothetical protein